MFRHLDSTGEPALTLGGYYCPQCRAKYTELPVECKVCGRCPACPCSSIFTEIFREHRRVKFSVCLLSGAGLTLVSAPHLARSFHHLFPLEAFQETPLEDYVGER